MSDNSNHPWQVLSPVLLGRTRELDTLSRTLLAASGSGQCFILAGEAGVGKTRLLSEIQQRALADHFLVLQGNCFEQDVSFPYAVIVDMLRTFFTAREAMAIRETLGPLAAEMIKNGDGIERRARPWEDWAITTRIDTARYWRQAWQAAACHRSQLPEYERLSQLPEEVFLKFWGCQTYYRAFSLVNGGRQVERDLFEGIR